MHYYILSDQQGYKILKVQLEDMELFQKRFGTAIICHAETLGELLQQFSGLLEREPSGSR